MKRSKFTDEQILAIVKEGEAGRKVADLCRANGITEQPLTGDVADKARAAVLAEYPDATIQRMETDAEGAAYEAHILQADGTPATVKLDDSFTITGLETGGPGGGHRGSGGDDSTSGFGTST